MIHPSLATFHPLVAAWFAKTFDEPSPPQAQGWPLIHEGKSILLLAPTGSGKTLAAFLKCLDWLYKDLEAGHPDGDGVRVLYISPLKALNNDIRRNLEIPLAGIAQEAAERGCALPQLTAAVRTGDTPARERQRMLRKPPHILITTPESLFLMLSSQAARILKTVNFLIVDEIHTLFPTKRGAHLSFTLERLEHLIGPGRKLQRIGLSATMKPLDQVAAYLGGYTRDDASGAYHPRPVTVVDTGQRKTLDLQIELPVPDMKVLPEKSIWPPLYEKVAALIAAHRTTLVFVNNRRLAERVTANLNQIAGRELARTHHGSIAKEVRLEVEEQLKSGALSCIVATASLELGIDIGFIDLVIQIESPKEVARGLQRVGRAGHLLGLPSKGRIIPKTRGDLLEATAILQEMKAGRVESAKAPRNCLDILAQQLVALTAGAPGVWQVETVYTIACGSYNFQALSRRDLENVLAMLSGNYDAREFLELKPRLYWDRTENVIRPDAYGKRLVFSSGGTIPDRGYFGVYLQGAGVRLGELDEEFVYERRLGERFVLGTSLWKIEEIRQDRVIVSPARRGEAIIPFWKADQGGRGYELGQRIGAFYAQAEEKLTRHQLQAWLQTECSLTPEAAANLAGYLAEQHRALGVLPNDSRLVIEEFPDESGEWRVLIHSPYGAKLHMALGLLIRADWKEHDGLDIEMMPGDDGIMFHCPGGIKPPRILWDRLHPEQLEEKLAALVSGTALFGTVFRHAAGRALVLPRLGFGKKRTPLWLARLKAGNLLQVVAKYRDFPLVVEAYREILQDYYETGALQELLRRIGQGAVQIQSCRRETPSPFAYAHLFNFIGNYMYEADTPKGASAREQHLSLFGLDRDTLRALIGPQGFRDLLAPQAITATVIKAQGLEVLQKAAGNLVSPEQLLYWLEKVGDLEAAELDRYFPQEAAQIREQCRLLMAGGKIIPLSFGNEPRHLWVARLYLPEYLTALPSPRPEVTVAATSPLGSNSLAENSLAENSLVENSFAEKVEPLKREKALQNIISRYARTHGPFSAAELARRYQLPQPEIEAQLSVLAAAGLVTEGEFLPQENRVPNSNAAEWCEVNILKEIHRRSLVRTRHAVETRGPESHLQFLAAWQRVGQRRGLAELAEAINQLEQLWLPADLWEKTILPGRVTDYRSAWLDQLCGSGQFRWRARGAPVRSRENFAIAFEAAFPEVPSFLATVAESVFLRHPGAAEADNPLPAPSEALSGPALQILDLLKSSGALSLPAILQATAMGTVTAWAALEELILAGMVSNDSFGPIRYLLETGPKDRSGSRGVLMPAQLAKMGRWSLLPPNEGGDWRGRIGRLFRRYGMICREIVATEGTSWGELYPLLDTLENIGKIKRGYFIKGLSGIQYILPEALEELRANRFAANPEAVTLAWEDPANISRFQAVQPEESVRGDFLTYLRGELVLTSGGKNTRARLSTRARLKLRTVQPIPDADIRVVLKSLVRALYWAFPNQKSVLTHWDGTPVVDSQFTAALAELGFEKNYREMILWPSEIKKELLLL